MTGRERVFALLEGRPVDRFPLMPITMLLAADRIGAPYGRYNQDYKVLVEAQLATAAAFDFDHVSAITETREALDCGATVRYFDDQPYAMDESRARLAAKSELGGMIFPDPWQAEHMHDRLQGLSELKRHAGHEKIVEGWVEGPCGAASDLRGINTLMTDFADDEEFIRDLFEFVTEGAIRFGQAQVEAGADVIGIGDPAASLVGPRIYTRFVFPYEKRVVDGLHAAGAKVRLHICGNTKRIMETLGRLGCDLMDVDSLVPLPEARRMTGPRQVLLGNIDPVRTLQTGTPEQVEAAIAQCARDAGPAYIAGAGCEVPRGTPAENLRAMARGAAVV